MLTSVQTTVQERFTPIKKTAGAIEPFDPPAVSRNHFEQPGNTMHQAVENRP